MMREILRRLKYIGLVTGLLTLILITGLFAANGAATYAQTSTNYRLTWWTVDNGGSSDGVDASTPGNSKEIIGGSYELYSTGGQPDAHTDISGGAYTLQSGFWPSYLLQPGYVYLPVILKSPAATAPDLVGTFTLSPNKSSYSAGEPVLITAVITNQGTAAAGAFWVDFYINPSTTPVINARWNDICGISPCKGIAWYVSGGLGAGQSITLTSTPASYSGPHTDWPGSFAGGVNTLYLYVDVWNPGVSTGGVAESDESNNLYQHGAISVSGLGVTTESEPLPDIPSRPAP